MPQSFQAPNGVHIIHAIHRRQFPEGRSSVGIRALQITAHIRSLETATIEAHLDSGADVTLMSEDFLNTLADPSRIQEGVCMWLYQLTGSARVLGYVRTKLLVHTTTGEVVAFKLEAYVVHGMRVPLLLEEDFQTTYELGVAHQASGQCEVFPSDLSYCLQALSSANMDIGFKVCKAYTGQAFLKGKHRVRAHRQLRGSPKDVPPVLACCTVHISLGCVFNMLVDAPFRTLDTWLVKKMLMLDKCNEFASTPTTIISTNNPYVPIANPMEQPVMIKKGDVVGHLYDPQEYLDAPHDKETMVK
ncbi:hypothetical protein BDN71DRAFT_1387958 [Pleurotus eryngii]|uniref:Peptidase A2 domain-containing protein n=1 Tax=Pleurotus eryngii TaxID=5323 RepID=A0A9P6A0Z0_PLEER|nr:hypothetical protein BDN71DRAFT_1387958 [Pleurotus eryngii]